MSSEMNWRFALLLRILVNSVPALLLFGGIELSVRAAFWFRNAVAEATPIVYVFGRDAGPHPPWRRSIIERDRLLSWRSHPNFKENWIHIFSPAQSAAAQRQLIQQFCPRIPDEVRVKPRDLVSLNAEGFRGENFREAKPEGIYRIISLGDSWTFGTSVGQYQTYPALLEAELNRLDLRKRYEVINLSVPGYSSYHGTLLMKRAVELNPDLIIIGYAMNEPEMAGYKSESTMVQLWRFFVYFANEGLQSVNLARYWARLLSYREDSPVVGLTKDALWHEKVATAVEQPAWLNESLREYKARILLMSNAARARGIRVILLYPEFWLDGPYLRVLKDISHEFNLPLVDWSGLLARASQIQVADRETRFGIALADVRDRTRIFRTLLLLEKFEPAGRPDLPGTE